MVMIMATMLPSNTFAASIESSGTCGTKVNWQLDSEGTLTISGSGDMRSFDGQFKPYKVKKVVVKSGVTSIYWGAFEECFNLESASIAGSVKTIESSAFEGCEKLRSVTLSTGITSIGSRTFRGCESLTGITLPNSVKTIGYSAFYGCSGLNKINIPGSVTSIGGSAFEDCSKLASVTLPNSITVINDNMFESCIGLNKVVIPNNVTSIGWGAFENCTGLKNVTIPAKVETIGCYAFAGCGALTDINISNGVEKIKTGAFKNCTSLADITIPDSVTSIESDAFRGCTALTDIEIPDSIKTISGYVFYGCTDLSTVTIPGSVREISYNAFNGCSSLTSIKVPDSVEDISWDAFPETTTIVAKPGSAAHEYAKENGNKFNCDGEHAWNGTHKIVKATTTKNGVKYIGCSDCDAMKNSTVIPAAKSIKLSATGYTFDKKTKKPAVSITCGDGSKMSTANYTVKYSSAKNVGTHKVTVTFKNNYSGTKTLTYKISPKGVSVSKLSKSKKAFAVKWKKPSSAYREQITGYQIKYSTSSKMTKAKTVTVKGAKATNKKISKLKAKKSYYVQIRTYKTVKDVKYYSEWSKVKSVKTR